MNKDYIWKVTKWAALFILAAYVLLVIVRIPYVMEKKKTDQAVAKIHATKLTLDDVMGKNLPVAFAGDASSSRAYYDATIAGVDVNKNGIRDDVELAIFKAYPNSAKTRAVLLQYALALQMEMTQSIVNTETVTAVAEEEGRAYYCVGELTPRTDMENFIDAGNKLHGFVENLQFNKKRRLDAQRSFFNNNLSSYSDGSGQSCDIDLSTLRN